MPAQRIDPLSLPLLSSFFAPFLFTYTNSLTRSYLAKYNAVSKLAQRLHPLRNLTDDLDHLIDILSPASLKRPVCPLDTVAQYDIPP